MSVVDGVISVLVNTSTHIVEVVYDDTKIDIPVLEAALVSGGYSVESITEIGGEQQVPPVADAGSDITVLEGTTIVLDGSNSHGSASEIVMHIWNRIGEHANVETNWSGPMVSMVTPSVDADGAALEFTLTVENEHGLRHTDDIIVHVMDNGITGFPEGALPFFTATDKQMGIQIMDGGMLSFLDVMIPEDLADTEGRPADLIYGLIDFTINMQNPGGTTSFVIHLPEPAPKGYTWYKFNHDSGWMDYSQHVTLNPDRTQITVTVTDGGPGDDDGVADGIITDPSGLGRAADGDSSDDTADSDTTGEEAADTGGGGGGCFISSIW